jgi:hypothetical protein
LPRAERVELQHPAQRPHRTAIVWDALEPWLHTIASNVASPCVSAVKGNCSGSELRKEVSADAVTPGRRAIDRHAWLERHVKHAHVRPQQVFASI